MAKDLNNLSIIGRAVKDAVIAYTGSNVCYAKFSIAVNGWKDNEVSFFDCIMWGKPAENVGKYITKGKQCAYTGEIKQTKWQDRETNATRYGFQINVLSVELLGGGQRNESPAQATEQLFKPSDPTQLEDDIPF